MKRREFIKYSGIAIGSGAFALYGLNLLQQSDPSPLFETLRLTPKTQNSLMGISQIILPEGATYEAVLESLKRMDEFIAQLPPGQKDELQKIFDLLESNALIKRLTSTAYDFNSREQVARMLNSWKTSFDHFILENDLRKAYKALSELFYLSFYSLPEGQRIAGYRP